MPDVTYEIVQHDGGWPIKSTAYFRSPSRPMPRRSPPRGGFCRAGNPRHSETIEYEDDRGAWHTETASGRDRPHTPLSRMWIERF